MKRLSAYCLSIITFISLFLLAVLPVQGLKLPTPNSSFYVYDEANLISTSTELEIVKLSEALEKESGAQIVVVTLESLSNYDLDQYAVQLFRQWGIGDAKKNNGVLIILSYTERDVRIEVGYGLEGAIPDSVAGRILDESMLPSLKDGNYDKAFLDTYTSVLNRVMNEYGITSLEGVEASGTNSEEIPLLWIIIIGIILLTLDGFFLHGFFFNLFFRIILYSLFNGGGSRGSFNRGGGGRSGGGGASRGW